MDISQLQRGNVVRGRQVDTTAHREQRRQRRLWTMVVVLGGPLAWCVARELSGHPVRPGVPDFVRDHPEWVLPTAMLALVGVGLLIPYISAGRPTPWCDRTTPRFGCQMSSVRQRPRKR